MGVHYIGLISLVGHSAIQLIEQNLSAHAEDVANLILSRLPYHNEFGDWNQIWILVRNLRPEFKQRILADRWLRDKFHREAIATEGNCWFTGSKAAAIECLAEFDRDIAFRAARCALQTPEWHDRERYPYILYEIDAGRAIPLLIEHLNGERAGHVRHAIGRVLGNVDLTTDLSPRFNSEDTNTRVTACFAAGWARDGALMSDLLHRSLNDRSERVIYAAMDAIDRLHERAICAELLLRANATDDLALKWMYIDAIVDVVDPSDNFRPWPSELQIACKNLSPFLREYIFERVKERRKKLFDKLKKAPEED